MVVCIGCAEMCAQAAGVAADPSTLAQDCVAAVLVPLKGQHGLRLGPAAWRHALLHHVALMAPGAMLHPWQYAGSMLL